MARWRMESPFTGSTTVLDDDESFTFSGPSTMRLPVPGTWAKLGFDERVLYAFVAHVDVSPYRHFAEITLAVSAEPISFSRISQDPQNGGRF